MIGRGKDGEGGEDGPRPQPRTKEMTMIIEILTRLQWLERGRIVKPGAVGQWRYPCPSAHTAGESGKVHYYAIEETKSRPEQAARMLEKRKAERNAQRRRHRAWQKAQRERWANCRTAQEWLKAGRVPNPDAIWQDDALGDSHKLAYLPLDAYIRDYDRRGNWIGEIGPVKCHIDDTTEDADRARQILQQEQRARGVINWMYDTHTAWQWIVRGRVPEPWAEWGKGLEETGRSPDYWYCHECETREDLERARELLAEYDAMIGKAGVDVPPPLDIYDGRPWW